MARRASLGNRGGGGLLGRILSPGFDFADGQDVRKGGPVDGRGALRTDLDRENVDAGTEYLI